MQTLVKFTVNFGTRPRTGHIMLENTSTCKSLGTR